MRHTIFTIITLTMMIVSMKATAQTRFFGRIGAGTPVFDNPFKGIAAELNGGVSWKGAEIGATLGFYTHGGTDYHDFIQIDDYGDKTYISNNKPHCSSRGLGIYMSANLGYDLLHLLKQPSRHHLTPFIELGYAQIAKSSTYDNSQSGLTSFGINDSSTSGFEFTPGCRYEFDITGHLTVGIFAKVHILVLDRDLAGLTLKYSLPIN